MHLFSKLSEFLGKLLKNCLLFLGKDSLCQSVKVSKCQMRFSLFTPPAYIYIIWIFQYQTTDNYHYLPPANLLIISTRIILTLHYPYLVMMDFYITFATYFYRGNFEMSRKSDFVVVPRHSWQRWSMVSEYIQAKVCCPLGSWNCTGSEILQW